MNLTSSLPLRKPELVLAGILGTVAAAFGTAGEFLMMWSPEGGYPSYENLLYASAERSRLGFFLGVLAVPLYFFGYLMVYQSLHRVSRGLRLAILAVALYSFAAGNVWLGARAILAGIVKHGDLAELVALVTELTEPVLNVVRILVVLLSLALIYVIGAGKSVFPRWFAFFTPGLLLGMVFLLWVVLPSVGNYLLPPAMNLVQMVFFGLGTWLFAHSVETAELVTRQREDLLAHSLPYAHDHEAADFETAIRSIRPQVLIGATGHPGTFPESVVRLMAELNDRPTILALSNPTSRAECTPQQAYDWSDGRVVFASGSPFGPVQFGGSEYRPGQGNNVYIFPGVGLGAVVAEASRITEEMFLAAACTLADFVTEEDLAAGAIYPRLDDIRAVSIEIAGRVAELAWDSGLARAPQPANLRDAIVKYCYDPSY